MKNLWINVKHYKNNDNDDSDDDYEGDGDDNDYKEDKDYKVWGEAELNRIVKRYDISF